MPANQPTNQPTILLDFCLIIICLSYKNELVNICWGFFCGSLIMKVQKQLFQLGRYYYSCRKRISYKFFGKGFQQYIRMLVTLCTIQITFYRIVIWLSPPSVEEVLLWRCKDRKLITYLAFFCPTARIVVNISL